MFLFWEITVLVIIIIEKYVIFGLSFCCKDSLNVSSICYALVSMNQIEVLTVCIMQLE